MKPKEKSTDGSVDKLVDIAQEAVDTILNKCQNSSQIDATFAILAAIHITAGLTNEPSQDFERFAKFIHDMAEVIKILRQDKMADKPDDENINIPQL